MALVALALLGGCDRNIEPYRADEEPRPPDLGRIFPGPPPGEAGEGGGPGQALAAAEAGAGRAALPPARTEGAGPAPAATQAAAPIRGRVELAADLGPGADPSGVLFVIARPEGVRAGPPLAVLRIPDPSFPVEFSIGPENVMIPSMRFEGALSLSARLDADGNAMTRGASDLESATREPLAPGASDVRLVLGGSG